MYYCFEKHVLKRKRDWLNKIVDRGQVDKIFKTISMLDKDTNNRDSVVLYGGEPLQKQNSTIIKYILDCGRDLGYSFMIVTKGVDLAEFVPILINYEVKKIQVTLDGPKEIHNSRGFKADGTGSFDDIVAGIEAAKKRGYPYGSE